MLFLRCLWNAESRPIAPNAAAVAKLAGLAVARFDAFAAAQIQAILRVNAIIGFVS